MEQTRPTGVPPRTVPSFYITGRQQPRPGAILLAVVIAALALTAALRARSHATAARQAADSAATAARTVDTPSQRAHAKEDEEKDDPSQVDTIVLGDAADAPVPARKGDHVSPVHATIIVRLPRYGEERGLIPNSPAGHLLYGWLAAFNQASSLALDNALPNKAPTYAAAAQMALRLQTGGFLLLSAKEVQPGLLVFRLRDQTPAANEVLGTLQMRPNSDPATIASFSLRAIPSPHKNPATTAPLPTR